MGPQHTDNEKLCKYMSTYSTNPKHTLTVYSWELVDMQLQITEH